MIQRHIILFLFFINALLLSQFSFCNPQDKNKLWQKYHEAATDVAKDDCLQKLFWIYINENIDTTKYICNLQNALLTKFSDNPIKQLNYNNNYAVFLELIGKFDSAYLYYLKALHIAETLENIDISPLYNNIGINCEYRGKYAEALDYYNKALEGYLQKFQTTQLSGLLSNMGLVYFYQGNYSKALEYLYKSIWFSEFYGNRSATSMTLNNIAMIYDEIENFRKAINIYHYIIKTSDKFGNQLDIALSYLNLGNTFKSMKQNDSALVYYKKGLFQAFRTGNLRTQYDIYIALSEIYIKQNKYDSAFLYLSKAALPVIKSGNSQSILNFYAANSLWYFYQKQFLKAKQFALLQYQYGKVNHTLVHQQQAANLLHQIYYRLRQLDSAYYYQALYYQIKDTIDTQKQIKTIVRIETEYAYEIKKQSLNIAHQLEMQEQRSRQQKQKLLLFLVIVICVSLFIVVFWGLKSHIKARRQHKLLLARKNKIENQKNQLLRKNAEIQSQKHEIIAQRNELEKTQFLIQQKNKDITDSIQYAQKIQNAFIPTIECCKKLFNGIFIIFKAKDIVSGDFYWITQSDGWKFMAVADCTGHGVPGAFVSIVGYNLLNQALKDISYPQPYKLLNYVSNGLHELLNKNNMDEMPADGMDITIIAIHENKQIITIAGAKTSCIYISKNILHHLQFDVFSAGRKFDSTFTTYQQKEFKLQKGDMWYFFTDGYYDQFGGANNRKFMIKQFKEILLQIHHLPLAQQQQTLEIIHQDWKMQCQSEQVDDILVIGIKIE